MPLSSNIKLLGPAIEAANPVTIKTASPVPVAAPTVVTPGQGPAVPAGGKKPAGGLKTVLILAAIAVAAYLVYKFFLKKK